MSDFKTDVFFNWVFSQRDKYYEYWKKECGYEATEATESAFKAGFLEGAQNTRHEMSDKK